MNQMSGTQAAGTLDPSFGTNGVVSMPEGATAILALANNKLMVITEWVSTSLPYRVARFTESGAPDGSFGTGGVVEVAFETGINFYPSQIHALQNGGYLITGARKKASDTLIVVRLLEHGALDTSFGDGGVVTLRALDAGGSSNILGFVDEQKMVGDVDVIGHPWISVSEHDAKIYLSASLRSNNGYKGIVFRLDENGSRDSSFSGGHVLIEVPDAHVSLGSLAAQGGGVLVACASFASNGPEGDAFVIRYDESGKVDTSFGNRGILMIPNGNEERRSRLTSMVLNPDGDILVSGYSVKGDVIEGLISVLNPNGSFHLIFNKGEPLHSDFLGKLLFWECHWQQDKKVIVAGNGDEGCLVVARYNLDGLLDLSFGGQGWADFRHRSNAIHHNSDLTADNKIVILGEARPNEGFAVRYLG